VKNLTWQNPGQLFVAQELIKIVKLKCCGIKEKYFSKTCYHDFVYKLKNPKAKVRVEATDEYGNTYTQDTFTEDLASALH